jgi:hypothetical protein
LSLIQSPKSFFVIFNKDSSGGKMKSIRNALLAAVLSLGASFSSHAALLFTYTGNPFTFDTINSEGGHFSPFAPPPTDRFTASLVMDVASNYTGDLDYLSGSGFSIGTNNVISWSFQAGSATLNSGDPTINAFSYRFTLNDGQITGWYLDAESPATVFQTLSENYEFFAPNEAHDIVLSRGAQLEAASVYSAQGIWTVSAVPEPATYAMMFAGLGIIGLLTWRRKNRAA